MEFVLQQINIKRKYLVYYTSEKVHCIVIMNANSFRIRRKKKDQKTTLIP
jgi:hypothetical protein